MHKLGSDLCSCAMAYCSCAYMSISDHYVDVSVLYKLMCGEISGFSPSGRAVGQH